MQRERESRAKRHEFVETTIKRQFKQIARHDARRRRLVHERLLGARPELRRVAHRAKQRAARPQQARCAVEPRAQRRLVARRVLERLCREDRIKRHARCRIDIAQDIVSPRI